MNELENGQVMDSGNELISPEVENQTKDVLEESSYETKESLSEETLVSADSAGEEEKYVKIPPGALAEMRRKAREAGSRETLLQLQREYEELQKRQQGPQESVASQGMAQLSPASPASLLPNEGLYVRERGFEKYPGTKFDAISGTMIGSFEHVVIEPAKKDPYLGMIAGQIMESDFPIPKEDVLYKVFSDQNLVEDLRYMNPMGIRRKVQAYLWQNQQKPKPVSRPPNPPLSEIKASANTKQAEKEPSLFQRIELYKDSKKR